MSVPTVTYGCRIYSRFSWSVRKSVLVIPHWAFPIAQLAELRSGDSFASICCLSYGLKRQLFDRITSSGFCLGRWLYVLDSIRDRHCPFFCEGVSCPQCKIWKAMEHFPTCFQIHSSFSALLPAVSAARRAQGSWPLQSAICLFYLWKQNKFLCVLFYFLHDRIFCFHLQPLQLPRIFTPCGLSRRAGFNSLPPGPVPRSRIPSFSFPVLSCILQGPSPYIAAAVVTKGTGTRHTPAATVTAAERSPSSNDNSMTSDTLLRKKTWKGGYT